MADFKRGHYRNILFCTDFSKNARVAFDFAVDAVQRNPGARLTLLHVMPEPGAQFWKGYIHVKDEIEQKVSADIEDLIQREYLAALPAGVEATVTFLMGEAAQMILEHATIQQSDLIILGRQGKGALTQWLMGNVATRVVKFSQCPVLVIPPL